MARHHAGMPARTLTINRAPVLTLWAAVVAERLGYDADEAATFGKTEEAFALYEVFRPEIPRGTRGWGAKGVLDLEKITAMAKETH
jgi:hypothetical protein